MSESKDTRVKPKKKLRSTGPLTAKVAPSLLACDFGKLAEEAKAVVEAGADWLHIDTMDGHFVPNFSFGLPTIRSLRKHSSAFFDCHVMIDTPEKWVEQFADAGADQYTFHVEATDVPEKVISQCHQLGVRACVAVKPKTPVDVVVPYLKDADAVMIMTVEPGFGGQKFMSDMMCKVSSLRKQFPTLDISIDGGVKPNEQTAGLCAEHGANILVSGSGIFKAHDLKKAVGSLRSYIEAGGHVESGSKPCCSQKHTSNL